MCLLGRLSCLLRLDRVACILAWASLNVTLIAIEIVLKVFRIEAFLGLLLVSIDVVVDYEFLHVVFLGASERNESVSFESVAAALTILL